MAAQQVSPVFDLSHVSESARNELMTIIHSEVTAFFAQPGVAEAFEEWKNKRKEKTNESNRSND